MIANKQSKKFSATTTFKMGLAPYKQTQQQQQQQKQKQKFSIDDFTVTLGLPVPNTTNEYVEGVLCPIYLSGRSVGGSNIPMHMCPLTSTIQFHGPIKVGDTLGLYIGKGGNRLKEIGEEVGIVLYANSPAVYAVYPIGYTPDAVEVKYVGRVLKAMMKYRHVQAARKANALPEYREPNFKLVERLVSDAVSAIGTSSSAGTSVSGDSSLPPSIPTTPGGAVNLFHQDEAYIAHMMTEMMDRVVARAVAREAAEEAEVVAQVAAEIVKRVVAQAVAEVAEVVANVAAEIVQQVVARAVAEEVAEAKATALAEAKAAKAAAIQAAVVKARAAKAAADRAAELSRRVRTEFPVIQHDTRPIRGHGRAQVLNGWWFEYGTWMVRTVEMHVTSSSYSGNQAFLVGHVVYVHPVMPFWFQ